MIQKKTWFRLLFGSAMVLFLSCGPIESGPPFAPAPDNPKWELSAAVVRILSAAHRSGSLIYRGSCELQNQITDTYLIQPPVAIEPMDHALSEITRIYPNVRWLDFGENNVRVFDSSARIDVLNLRIREFRVTGATTPEVAVSAIWSAPEVRAFAAAHHIVFIQEAPGIEPAEGTYRLISVNLANATIAEIMEKISFEYRPKSELTWHNVWLYHECESGRRMVVELRVI